MSDVTINIGGESPTAIAAIALAASIVKRLEELNILTAEQGDDLYRGAMSALDKAAALPDQPSADRLVAERASDLLRHYAGL